MQYVKPTIDSGVMTDIAVALSQSWFSLYAWYFSGFCQAMSAPGPPGVAVSGSGISAIATSVVRSIAAIDTES